MKRNEVYEQQTAKAESTNFLQSLSLNLNTIHMSNFFSAGYKGPSKMAAYPPNSTKP